jgi:hypothetical protein
MGQPPLQHRQQVRMVEQLAHGDRRQSVARSVGRRTEESSAHVQDRLINSNRLDPHQEPDMYFEYFVARQLIEDRMRDASQQRLAREFNRREQPSTAATPVRKARRHSRLWSLVHVRQAHS